MALGAALFTGGRGGGSAPVCVCSEAAMASAARWTVLVSEVWHVTPSKKNLQPGCMLVRRWCCTVQRRNLLGGLRFGRGYPLARRRKKEEARRGRPRSRFGAEAARLLGVPEANEASTGSTTGGGGLMRDRLGF